MDMKAPAAVLAIAILLAVAFSGCMEKKPEQKISKPNISAGYNLTVHYLDVGQGDSELIQFAGKNILIDAGESDMGSRVISYLQGHNVTSLDLAVATHPHSDHIGGLAAVLKAFPVKHTIDSGQTYSSQTYENLLNIIDKKNINYTVVRRGQKINLDPRLQITVLNPPAEPVDDNINDNSVVLRLTYGNISFLFMGDAETTGEKSLLSSGLEIHADILKAGHHGSSTSSSPEFLSAVDPDVKIIEVGAGNDYHHPSQKTLNALMHTGEHIEKSAIYRTDIDGNIDITTDGTSYFVATEKASGQPRESAQIQPPTIQPANYSVTISAVQFDAPGDDRKNLNGEWVQIKNSGRSNVNMTGWILDSSGERVYTFPRFILASGASVKVFSGMGSDGSSKLYMRRGSPVWSNKGDTSALNDAGGYIVSQRSG